MHCISGELCMTRKDCCCVNCKQWKLTGHLVPVNDKDFKLLSKWASTERTLRNVESLLEDYAYASILDEDRMQIALEEFSLLIPAVVHIAEVIKNLRFHEERNK